MTQITPTQALPSGDNSGIVPPWMVAQQPPRNPGIVPPRLQTPVHILPVPEEPIFTILPYDGDTQFVRESVSVSPMSLTDALRGR